MNNVQNSLINVAAPKPSKPSASSNQAAGHDSFGKLMNDQKQNLQQSETASNEAAPQAQNKGDAKADSELPSEQELEARIAMAAAAMMQTPVVVQTAIAPPENDQPIMLSSTMQKVDVDLDLHQPQQILPNGAENSNQMAVPVEELNTQSNQDTVSIQVQAPEKEQSTQLPEMAQAKDETQDVSAQAQQQEAPLFREVENVPIQVGETKTAKMEQKPVADQLAKGIENAVRSGESKVELELEPHNLGRVKIEMVLQEDGTMRVLLHAEKPQTQLLLQRDAGDLQALLGRTTQQQVEVEAPHQQEQPFNYDGQNGHEQQQQQQPRRNREENAEDFLHQLRLGLVDEE